MIHFNKITAQIPFHLEAGFTLSVWLVKTNQTLSHIGNKNLYAVPVDILQ